ncbi:UNVERIFIED_CONTAM: hypothetical protein K2H54_024118 [Gekko kuhli]
MVLSLAGVPELFITDPSALSEVVLSTGLQRCTAFSALYSKTAILVKWAQKQDGSQRNPQGRLCRDVWPGSVSGKSLSRFSLHTYIWPGSSIWWEVWVKSLVL